MAEKLPTRTAGGYEDDFGELNDWGITDLATAPKNTPEDRNNAEARENANAEHRREFNRSAGEAAIKAFDIAPTRVKINHPPRFISEKDELARKREAERKAADIKLASRRKIKESNKYENSFLNSKIIATSEARANMPLAEVAEQPHERVHSPESVEARAEKLYNYYEANFTKNAPRWISFGVSSLLEKSIVNPPTDSLLRSGFWAREEDRVHERIDPDDTLVAETIDAEAELRTRVSKDLIDKRSHEISKDELSAAKRDGMLYAIYSGARTDSRSGKTIYSIPSERGDDVAQFMKENGVNPNSEKIQLMSHNGFIGIVEAIKDDKNATEKGFKELDWYFDTFGYQKHMDEFIDTMDAYQENADKAFGDKLNEYLARRLELKEWQKQQLPKQDEAISALADAKTVTHDDFVAFIRNNMESGDSEDIFPIPDMNDRRGNHVAITRGEHPSSTEKCSKAMEELEKISELDPSASYAIGTVFERDNSGERKKKQDYALIRFGNNGFNNVIAIHIGDSSKAMFCWRGKTGEDADGWREYFRNSSIRNRNTDVKRFVCRGYGEKGFLALDAQWERIWDYLNSPDKENKAA